MSHFPIPKLDRLPTRISPCPIIEAVMEIRFVTSQSWSLLPGLLYNQIRERYPKTESLALGKLPEEVLKSMPDLSHKPLTSFLSEKFLIQFGPRVISLISNHDYPGWSPLFAEMKWLLAKIEAAGFISEGERLGMRYIDFFEGNHFPNLMIDVMSDGRPIGGAEMTFTTAFRRQEFMARLVLNNSAFVRSGNAAQTGSVFDLDLALPASEFELFESGLGCFERAHQQNKEIFFGLLKPEFLATLSPEYA